MRMQYAYTAYLCGKLVSTLIAISQPSDKQSTSGLMHWKAHRKTHNGMM